MERRSTVHKISHLAPHDVHDACCSMHATPRHAAHPQTTGTERASAAGPPRPAQAVVCGLLFRGRAAQAAARRPQARAPVSSSSSCRLGSRGGGGRPPGTEKPGTAQAAVAAAAIKAEPELGRALARGHLQLQLPSRPASALRCLLPLVSRQSTLLPSCMHSLRSTFLDGASIPS